MLQVKQELENKAKDMKTEYESILNLERGTEKLKELDNEYNWACVSQAENDLAYANKEYSGVKEQCAELDIELESVNAKLSTLGSNMK